MACRLRLKFKLINIVNEMDFILQINKTRGLSFVMIDDFKNLQVSLVALLEAVDQRKDVDVTAALHEEELDGDLEALDLVEYAQVARIKYDLDNDKSKRNSVYNKNDRNVIL